MDDHSSYRNLDLSPTTTATTIATCGLSSSSLSPPLQQLAPPPSRSLSSSSGRLPIVSISKAAAASSPFNPNHFLMGPNIGVPSSPLLTSSPFATSLDSWLAAAAAIGLTSSTTTTAAQQSTTTTTSSSSSSCHGVGGDPFSQMMFSSSPSFYVNYSNYITPPHPPGFDQQQQSSAKSSLMIPLLSDPELAASAKSKCNGMDGSDDDDQSPSNKKLLNSPSTSPLNLSISNECDSKIDQQTCQYSQASSSLLMSIKSEKRMINQMKSE